MHIERNGGVSKRACTSCYPEINSNCLRNVSATLYAIFADVYASVDFKSLKKIKSLIVRKHAYKTVLNIPATQNCLVTAMTIW